MEKKELYAVLKKLSEGFLDKKIESDLYAKIVETLILTNINIVHDKLEEFADFLAQYKHNPDMPELYGDKELTQKIKKIFKFK